MKLYTYAEYNRIAFFSIFDTISIFFYSIKFWTFFFNLKFYFDIIKKLFI